MAYDLDLEWQQHSRYRTKYSKMDQVKFVEDNPEVISSA